MTKDPGRAIHRVAVGVDGRSMRGRIGAASILAALVIALASSQCAAFSTDELTNGACPEGTKACSVSGKSQCVSIREPTTGCDRAACTPCALKNVKQHICNSRNTCDVSLCKEGFSDCDVTAEGCETETAFDPKNCGLCGTVCPARPHGSPACVSSVCGVVCSSGFLDCDRLAENGCEVESATDAQHCGTCERACAQGQSCVGGQCQ